MQVTSGHAPAARTEILVFQGVVIVVHFLPDIFQEIVVFILACHCKCTGKHRPDRPLAIGGSVNNP